MEDLARRYRDFAQEFLHGQSPMYERLMMALADDREVLSLIAGLPTFNKRQPNLLLAAVRYLGGPYHDYRAFREFLLQRWAEISATMVQRLTQTNEPARCSVLLPILASLPQPLALIEVGASAGLCLYPDLYRYRYDDGPALGPANSPAVFPCRTEGAFPMPSVIPKVVWRAGIDLNPLDIDDDDDRRWLNALIWPGKEHRAHHLQGAIEAVRSAFPRSDRARLVRGELREELSALVSEAPSDSTLVVFHTAVLVYLSLPEREEFAALVRALPCHWISNEDPGVLPWLRGPVTPAADELLLALDERPVACTKPHGQAIRWFADQ